MSGLSEAASEDELLILALQKTLMPNPAMFALGEEKDGLIGSLMTSAMYGALFHQPFAVQLGQWNLVQELRHQGKCSPNGITIPQTSKAPYRPGYKYPRSYLDSSPGPVRERLGHTLLRLPETHVSEPAAYPQKQERENAVGYDGKGMPWKRYGG